MWHSSPLPKYATASSGHWLASASSIRFSKFESTWRRRRFEEGVRLGQVLAVGSLALVEVGHGVEPQAVDAHVEPEVDDAEHRPSHLGIVEVEVGLVRDRSGASSRRWPPGPSSSSEVSKSLKMIRASLVLLGRVAPDVEVAPLGARRGPARALEPRVLVGGVVEDQLGDHPEAAAVGGAEEVTEILQRAVVGVHVHVVGDVVAVVPQRRRIEGQEPEGRDAEVLEVVELLGQPVEVADAVAVAVEERADVELVDDGVLVPEGVLGEQ